MRLPWSKKNDYPEGLDDDLLERQVSALVVDPDLAVDVMTGYVPYTPIPSDGMSRLDGEEFVVLTRGGFETHGWPRADGFVRLPATSGDGDPKWRRADGLDFVPRRHIYGVGVQEDEEVLTDETALSLPIEFLKAVGGMKFDQPDLKQMSPREFASDLDMLIDQYAEAILAEEALDRTDRTRFMAIILCGALVAAIVLAAFVYGSGRTPTVPKLPFTSAEPVVGHEVTESELVPPPSQ